MTIEQHIKNLQQAIIKHDISYGEGNPTITDKEYDVLYQELVELENQHPTYITQDSPTQKIYDVMVEELTKVQHSTPMLSQEKAHTDEEITKFLHRIDDDVLAQQKLDGLTIVLTYENGRFKQAVTRGDGVVGEDVTHAIRASKGVPQFINFQGRLEVRAEAVIPFSDFERINTDGKYRSPRNLVSGSVRTLSASSAKERGVQVIVFDLIFMDGESFTKDSERIEFLTSLGFKMVETNYFPKSQSQQLIEYCLSYHERVRSTLPHMIDGLVLKANDLRIRDRLGYTSKYPKWAIAFKFDSLDATTTLRDVFWTVGPSGQLTPNAQLDPVEIDGVVISKASLANIDNIKERDIRVGDQVFVTRANDVIPKVISSISEVRTGEEEEIEVPTHCPTCNSVLHQDGWKIMCQNATCPDQVKRRLLNFASRQGMNIQGLGNKTIEMLYNAEKLKQLIDIYDLHLFQEELLTFERFGEKAVQKMLKGIETSKEQPLHKLLFALSIPYCGEGTSKRIAKHFDSLSDLLVLNRENLHSRLIEVEDIGEIGADAITNYFMQENNREILEGLIKRGVRGKSEQMKVETNAMISEKTFVITGSLETGSRSQIKKQIEQAGGKVSGSVSKSTNYLVLGGYNHETGEGLDLTSSKAKKADQLNIPILSEIQLVEWLEG